MWSNVFKAMMPTIAWQTREGGWIFIAGSEESGYTLTRDFAVAMIEHFKAQKLIHRRFAFQILLQVWVA